MLWILGFVKIVIFLLNEKKFNLYENCKFCDVDVYKIVLICLSKLFIIKINYLFIIIYLLSVNLIKF